MHDEWIANRMQHIEESGIRKVFDLARSLKEPVNLSIGLPHFDVPPPVKAAAIAAIERGANAYTVTQGTAELRDKLLADVQRRYPRAERSLLVTSGTMGGLLLAIMTTVNPGDEVILFDPYFVAYPHLVRLAGGVPVLIDTYPDFRIDLDRVRAALTPRTRMILVNSPANPTGVVPARQALRDLAELARERQIIMLSDEVYRVYCYDEPFCSPAEFNDDVLVFDGFSKSHAMTGWRLGFAHGPRQLIEQMAVVQQFSFICAPSMVQHAGAVAWDYDVSGIVADYKQKRDRLCAGLRERFEFVRPGGAFYLFVKAPWGSGTDFVSEAIRNNLLIIPSVTFSKRDTHFRISYAAEDATIDRGMEILNRLARERP
jgi:aspartate aminotransferase/aminotransferase